MNYNPAVVYSGSGIQALEVVEILCDLLPPLSRIPWVMMDNEWYFIHCTVLYITIEGPS